VAHSRKVISSTKKTEKGKRKRAVIKRHAIRRVRSSQIGALKKKGKKQKRGGGNPKKNRSREEEKEGYNPRTEIENNLGYKGIGEFVKEGKRQSKSWKRYREGTIKKKIGRTGTPDVNELYPESTREK